MSIKTTYFITRKTALDIMFSKLQEVDDESLASMLEDFPESHFRNYIIVSYQTLKANDAAEYSTPSIKSINQF